MTETTPERGNYPELVLWECQCRDCGGWILTDEWIGSPYFGPCGECGGQGMIDDWQVSDEPHPAVWAMID